MFASSTLKKASILIALCCSGIFCAGQNIGNEASTDETDLVRTSIVKQKIQAIMQATLKEGQFTTAGGIKATTRVPPSQNKQRQEIRNKGSKAGGPENTRVPHSIAFCAIEWGCDTADTLTSPSIEQARIGQSSPQHVSFLAVSSIGSS